jgi:hypothetical protein
VEIDTAGGMTAHPDKIRMATTPKANENRSTERAIRLVILMICFLCELKAANITQLYAAILSFRHITYWFSAGLGKSRVP